MCDGGSLQPEGNDQGLSFPMYPPDTFPQTRAPYCCTIELEGESCKTEDRSVVEGLREAEELRSKELTETRLKLGISPCTRLATDAKRRANILSLAGTNKV